MRVSLIASILIPAAAVMAQSATTTSMDPEATSGITPCILQCVSSAADDAGCDGFTDLECICTSQEFQTAAGQCLQQSCTAEEVQGALALQQSQCGAISSATESLISEASTQLGGIQTSIASVTQSIASGLSSRASSASVAASSSIAQISRSVVSTSQAAATSSSAAGQAVSLPGNPVAIGAVLLAAVIGPFFMFA
ncbi:hypothetical protein FRC02_001447 [Tulasnella sp. 418]|nr:hypothetical protein FRC02_001447 [Tulasnella sp. 418]